MSIKPIDLQTNVAHMHEIAKGEHGRSAALIEGQHSLEENAEEHARRIRNKLEENKQAEKTSIKREEGFKKKNEKKSLHDKNSNKVTSDEDQALMKEEKMGLMIDVKR